jgi:hypothetical protein
MEEKLILDSFFKCQISSNDTDAHILKEPRVLPCGYTVCKDCILNTFVQNNSKKFKCNFDNCQREHLIVDIDHLGQNHLVVKVLNENIKYLSNDLLKKLQIEFENFKGNLNLQSQKSHSKLQLSTLDVNSMNENKNKIETMFEFIEGDIVIRVESIKIELESLQTDLINTIKSIKENFLKDFLHEFEIKKLNSEKLITSMKNIIQLNETSKEILRENMYKCQEYLNDLKKFDTSLNKKLSEVSFKCSDWLPLTSNIGSISGTSNLFTIAKAVTPNIINLSCCIKHIYGLCNFKDQYLFLASPEENKVYMLDENYHCVKSCASVGGRYFSKPYSLCTDGQTNIYLCDYGNNRILIIDENFEEIRKVIGKHGHVGGEFDGPIDIKFFNEQLFVLDEKNLRIQVLTKRGEFINEISLIDYPEIERPTRFGVLNDSIVVLDQFKNLIVYNFDGQVLQSIVTDQVNAFYVDDNFILTINDYGMICLYDKTSNKEESNNGFSFQLDRVIKNFEYDVSFTCFFNGNFVVSLGEYARLAVF